MELFYIAAANLNAHDLHLNTDANSRLIVGVPSYASILAAASIPSFMNLFPFYEQAYITLSAIMRTAELAVIEREDLRVRKRKTERQLPRGQATAGSESPTLFEHLRQLRLAIAQETSKPLYTIFPDKTLHALAADRPTTIEAFGTIFGVGEYKCETWGDHFVAAIKVFLAGRPEQSKPFAGAHKPAPNEKLPFPDAAPVSTMERQKRLYANSYRPWTEKDDALLAELYNRGVNIATLMETFKRNKGSIKSRLRKLELVNM